MAYLLIASVIFHGKLLNNQMGFIPLWSPFIRRHFLMGRLVQGCPPVLFLLLCLAAEAAAVQLCFFWGCEQKNGDFWGISPISPFGKWWFHGLWLLRTCDFMGFNTLQSRDFWGDFTLRNMMVASWDISATKTWWLDMMFGCVWKWAITLMYGHLNREKHDKPVVLRVPFFPDTAPSMALFKPLHCGNHVFLPPIDWSGVPAFVAFNQCWDTR